MPDEEKLEQTEALVKQDALPALDVVKNRDGSDRIIARQKGRFVKTANARVLAVQKSIERIMHALDDTSQTQLERIVAAQAKVCEENDSAKNLGGIAKFLEHVDEISGNKAAREALTRETNERVIPKVVIVVPDLMHKEVIDYEAEQRKAAEKKGPSKQFLDAVVVEQNPPKGEDKV